MIYIIVSIIFLVLLIGYVTTKINLRANCDHYWEERGNGDIRCAKCNKKVKDSN
jgi:hypothetical protein